MKCPAWLETRTKKKNGQPFKTKRSVTQQVSTIHHNDRNPVQESWHRCPGTLVGKVKISSPLYYDDRHNIDITIKCTNCGFISDQGLLVKAGMPYDQEDICTTLLNDYLNEAE